MPKEMNKRIKNTNNNNNTKQQQKPCQPLSLSSFHNNQSGASSTAQNRREILLRY